MICHLLDAVAMYLLLTNVYKCVQTLYIPLNTSSREKVATCKRTINIFRVFPVLQPVIIVLQAINKLYYECMVVVMVERERE